MTSVKRKFTVPSFASDSLVKRVRGTGTEAENPVVIISDDEDDDAESGSPSVIDLGESPSQEFASTVPTRPEPRRALPQPLSEIGTYPGFQSALSAIKNNAKAFVDRAAPTMANGMQSLATTLPNFKSTLTHFDEFDDLLALGGPSLGLVPSQSRLPSRPLAQNTGQRQFDLSVPGLQPLSDQFLDITSNDDVIADTSFEKSEISDSNSSDISIIEEMSTPARINTQTSQYQQNGHHSLYPLSYQGYQQYQYTQPSMYRPMPGLGNGFVSPFFDNNPGTSSLSTPFTSNFGPLIAPQKTPIRSVAQILADAQNEVDETDAMRRRALEGALAKMPKAKQPGAIKTSMLPHQLQALAWMIDKEHPSLPLVDSKERVQCWKRTRYDTYQHIYREISYSFNNPPELYSGGILADDMGLGKTLQIISLIMNDRGKGPTLIVCPLSVMSNWDNQIIQHVHDDRHVRVLIYHSQKSAKLRPEDLKLYDVIVTTYNKLAMEEGDRGRKVLTRVQWRRVVLDEGHIIRNSATKSCKAACQLKATSKWAVTGTPIINSTDDLRSLAIFIGVDAKLGQKSTFQAMMSSEKTCQAFVADLCLRRTKDMAFINLQLPPKTEHVEWIELEKEERENYKTLLEDAQQAARKFFGASKEDKAALWTTLLERLLRLRQYCDHWTLSARKALGGEEDVWNEAADADLPLDERLKALVKRREICRVCWDALSSSNQPVIGPCGHAFCKPCLTSAFNNGKISCPQCPARYHDSDLVETKFTADELDSQTVEAHKQSSKTIALYKLIKKTLKDPKSKIVVFSQWTTFLDIVQKELLSADLKFVRLDGKMGGDERDKAITALQTDKDTRIMLASLKTAGVGITLTAADTVVLADTWWAPAIEEQAVDRIHRLGQTRPTTVYRLVCKNTVEQGVVSIQDAKRKLFGEAFQEKFKVLTKDDTQDMVRRLLE